ncbi:MAG: FAD-dependent oxidoreductase [Trueperaceae bacterium]|nr:FAD-dependent oxidoreductase [Trueperaceae bacterium]
MNCTDPTSPDRTDHADVAVIGGGLGGLVAATHAARAGARVVLAERGPELGGRARSRRVDGFVLNLGAHALYRGGAAAAGLDELGVQVDGGVPGDGHAEFARELVALPQGAGSLLRASWLGIRGRLEALRVLAGLARPPTARLDGVSWGAYVRARATDPHARSLLLAVGRLATYAADECIAARAVLTNLRAGALQPVLYLHGGWQRLVDGVATAAQREGVHILTGTGSIVLARQDDGWRVRGDGLDLCAGAVVVAAGTPRRTSEVLSDVVDPATRASIAGRTPVRAAVLDVALGHLPRPDRTFVLGIDEPTYLSVHSAVAELAPPDGAVIHLARYLDSDEQAGTAERTQLEGLLDRVQPGWRDEVVDVAFLPDMTVTGDVAPAAAGGLAGRQPVEVEQGLCLAGDWVGSAGFLTDAVFASARVAGRTAAGAARNRRTAPA